MKGWKMGSYKDRSLEGENDRRRARDDRTRGLRTEVRDRWLEKLNLRRSEGEKMRGFEG
jgi:hypothetical protein